MKEKKNSDNWASLLTDLGLEEPILDAPLENREIGRVEEATAESKAKVEETAAVDDLPEEEIGSFGAGLFDEPLPPATVLSEKSSKPGKRQTPTESTSVVPEPPSEQSSRTEKKSFLARFPKINFFGSSTKETLDAVVEGVKAPSLSGKSFTSSTLEKVPGSTERAIRRSQPAQADPETLMKDPVARSENTSGKKPTESAQPDPWSQIASQVGALTGEPQGSKTANAEKKPSSRPSQRDNAEQGRGRKRPPSMFEEPIRESEESLALKNMIGNGETPSYEEEERRLQSMFVDSRENRSEESVAREPRDRKPREEERGDRGQRSTDRRGRSEKQGRREYRQTPAPAEEQSSEMPKENRSEEPRVRGRRGSRYAEDPQKQSSPIVPPVSQPAAQTDAYDEPSSWDVESESKPVERGRRRRGRRSDKPVQEQRQSMDPQAFDEDDSPAPAMDFSQLHKKMPSWDEAIGAIVDGNIARRSQQQPRKGRR